MKNHEPSLRKRAEEFLNKNPDAVKEISTEDFQGLIEELHIHQIELEMQNKELRQAQLELEAVRDRFVDLFDYAPVGYITASEKGLILEANLTVTIMLGVERSVLIGEPFSRFISRDTQDDFYFLVNKLLETKAEQTCELKLVKKDGFEFYAQLNCSPVKDLQGDFNQLGVSITDISDRKLAEEALRKVHAELEHKVEERTAELVVANEKYQKEIEERKQAEEALREREKKYHSLVESIHDWVWSIDIEGRITFTNEAVKHILGYDVHELLGSSSFFLMHPEDQELSQRLFKQAVKQKRGWKNAVVRMIQKDGSVQFIESSAQPIIDVEGRLVGFTGIDRDITERKRVEEALQQKTHDLGKRVKELNCIFSISNLVGLPYISLDEVFQGVVNIIPPAWQYPDVTCSRIIINGKEYETENFKETNWKQTSDIFVHGKLKGILEVYYLEEKPEIDEGPFVKEERRLINAITERLGYMIERKQAEEALLKSEERYRSLVENINLGVTMIDSDHNIVMTNATQGLLFGKSVSEFVGKKCFREFEKREMVCPHCPGTQAMNTGQPAEVETEGFRDDGTHFKARIQAFPVFRQDSAASGFIEVVEDITEKKKLEAQLQQAQKMESIGTLAGGIAHDFNNILWIINGNTELMLDDIPKENPARYHLGKVEDACRRATDLVGQILSFSRPKTKKMQPLKFSSIIKESLKLLRSSLPTTIEIRKNISTASDIILADLTQTNQVLMNLYTNAFQAMRESGGVLEVSLVNMEIDEKEAFLHPTIRPGKHVVLSVRDTGHGIKPENIDRIFDPYFTTKQKGGGTGLGLSVAYGIIVNHGGTVTVESTPGHGAVFHVFLPVADEHEIEPQSKPFEMLPSGSERILFVDDEQGVVDMAEKMLKRLGYEVATSRNPMEALNSFKAQPEKYDLVFTDQSMPYMTGENLAKEILSIRPDVPIILCTGFSELVSEEKAKAHGIKAYLMKPIVKGVLAETIRKVLDEK